MSGFTRLRFAVAFLLGLVAWGHVARAEESLDWDPARTWVFAVGLLEWEREDLWAPFPAAMIDRRDEQLVDYFRDAGVDEDRISYLQDSDATKADVEAA